MAGEVVSAGGMSASAAVGVLEEFSRLLGRWQRDPVAFAIECFGVVPMAWQADGFRRLMKKRKLAVASGHGVGKTRFLALAIWYFMLTQKRLGQKLVVPCTGPSGANIGDVLWAEVNLLYGLLPLFLKRRFEVTSDQIKSVEGAKEWFAVLRTSRREQPDALQGFHGDPILFVIDEAAGVPDEVFEVARGALSTRNSYAIMTGNPTRLSGYFYNAFNARETMSMWDTMQVSCEDNLDDEERVYAYTRTRGRVRFVTTKGLVSRGYVDEMRQEFGEDSPTYKARVSGAFPFSEADQVVRREWVEAAWNRVAPEHPGAYDRIMGVDVAWSGQDDSSLCVRCGDTVEECDTWHGNDTSQSADKVAQRFDELRQAKREPKYIAVDANGVGAGVYASLRQKGLPAIPVWSGENAPDGANVARCARLRDWLWWQARLYFRDRKACFLEKGEAAVRLRDELTWPRYKAAVSGSGKLQVESKSEIAKRNRGRSPDVADAFCLTLVWGPSLLAKNVGIKAAGGWKKKKRGVDAKLWRLA